MSITVTVNGQSGVNVTAKNGDQIGVTVSPAGTPGGQGATGPAGPAASLAIGTVASGDTASATITGNAPNQMLNLVLPRGSAGPQGAKGDTGATGAAGPANSLSIGTVAKGDNASATITGTAPSQTLNLTLPKGDTGPQGPAGPAGPPINLSDETPQPLGTASAGTALAAARADHVHVVPTIAYGSLTGIPSTFAPSAHQHVVGDVTGLQTALDGKQAAGAYATLVNGQVPSAQLPSFVDDVVDVGGTLPASGEVGKIYVVSTGTNVNKIYRWSGSTYIEISPSPGSTDAVPEGSVNLYHTTARAAAAAPVQSVAGRTGAVALTKTDVGLSNVPNTDATARANHTGTQTASTISDFAVEAAKYGPAIPTASSTVLGGIKVGGGLAITDGVLAVSGGGGGGGGVEVVPVPQYSDSPGTVGQVSSDSAYVYLCVGSSSWVRAAISPFEPSIPANAILSESGDYLTTETGDSLAIA